MMQGKHSAAEAILDHQLTEQVIEVLLRVNYELDEMQTDLAVSPALTEDLSAVRLGIRDLADNLRRICGNLRPLTVDCS
jgi:hypothetical protein